MRFKLVVRKIGPEIIQPTNPIQCRPHDLALQCTLNGWLFQDMPICLWPNDNATNLKCTVLYISGWLSVLVGCHWAMAHSKASIVVGYVISGFSLFSPVQRFSSRLRSS